MQHNPLPWHLVLSGANLDGHKTTCRLCCVPEGAALVTPKLRKGERKSLPFHKWLLNFPTLFLLPTISSPLKHHKCGR